MDSGEVPRKVKPRSLLSKRKPAAESNGSSSEDCQHPGLFKGLCIKCGKKVQKIGDADSHAEENEESSLRAEGKWRWKRLTMRGGHSLELSGEEQKFLSQGREERLRAMRKLCLVLDIDNTLLHATATASAEPPITNFTVNPVSFDPEKNSETDLIYLPLVRSDRGRQAIVQHYWIKLRPNLLEFLEEANRYCEMTLYTHGTRPYATAVASALDPTGKYFGSVSTNSSRVVSCTDVPDLKSAKSIDRVFLGEANMAIIMDDREDVWQGPQQQQLLMVKPFIYFNQHDLERARAPGCVSSAASSASASVSQSATTVTSSSASISAPSPSPSPSLFLSEHDSDQRVDRNGDEIVSRALQSDALRGQDSQLSVCLEMIKTVHGEFFGSNDALSSGGIGSKTEGELKLVSTIISKKLSSLLQGCVVMFSGLIPTNQAIEQLQFHPLWRCANILGARVLTDSDLTSSSRLSALPENITHLIAANTGPHTKKVTAALERKNVWVLRSEWLWTVRWQIERVNEESFLIAGAIVPSLPLSTSTDNLISTSVGTSAATSPSPEESRRDFHRAQDWQSETINNDSDEGSDSSSCSGFDDLL